MPDKIEATKNIPDFNSITDLRLKRDLIFAFDRLYDYLDYKLKQDLDALKSSILKTNIQEFSGGNLIGDLARKLIGSTTTDPLLQEVGSGTISSVTITLPSYMTGSGTDNADPITFVLDFANQSPLTFFAGPISGIGAVGFRGITHADIASLDLLRTSSALDPALADLPNDGNTSIHKNTTSGNIFLAYNNAGVIVKVQLI